MGRRKKYSKLKNTTNIRNIPVVNSKYLPVWKRARFKIRVQQAFNSLTEGRSRAYSGDFAR